MSGMPSVWWKSRKLRLAKLFDCKNTMELTEPYVRWAG